MNQMKIVLAATLLASNVTSLEIDPLGQMKIDCYWNANSEATGFKTGADFGACDNMFPTGSKNRDYDASMADKESNLFANECYAYQRTFAMFDISMVEMMLGFDDAGASKSDALITACDEVWIKIEDEGRTV